MIKMTTSSATDKEQNVYTDLVSFLRSDRADLRLAASEGCLGVTDRDGMAHLIQHGAVEHLCRLSSQADSTGTNALATLVNLSSLGMSLHQCVLDMIENGAVTRMAEISLSGSAGIPHEMWRKRVNYSLALLANMTREERGAMDLCGHSTPPEAVTSHRVAEGSDEGTTALPSKPIMSLLLHRFLSLSHVRDMIDDGDQREDMTVEQIGSRHDDPFQHYAAILMNATQVEQGRRFVMRIHRSLPENEASTSVLQQILPQLRSKNPVRRRGIAGAIKNCCFDGDSVWWLVHEVNLVKHLLYPLSGPEELDMDEKHGMDPDLWLEGPDKVRDPDPMVRLFLVEAILLLCASGRRTRESLRIQRTYVILKMADMVEEAEPVTERIEECVQFLRRDEEGTTEGSSDGLIDRIYDSKSRKTLALPTRTQRISSKNENYDDID